MSEDRGDFRKLFKYLTPKDGTWKLVTWTDYACGFLWENSMGARAISSIHEIDGKPQYHVSFSHQGQRINHGWMEPLLKQWNIESFEEDNHVPNGKVRNFWKSFDPEQKQCRCKDIEEPHEEVGGYVWREDKSEVKK